MKYYWDIQSGNLKMSINKTPFANQAVQRFRKLDTLEVVQ